MSAVFEDVAHLDGPTYRRVLNQGEIDARKVIEGKRILRPSLALAGFCFQSHTHVVLFDSDEMSILDSLSGDGLSEQLGKIIVDLTPAVIVADGVDSGSLARRCLETRTPLIECSEPSQKVLAHLIHEMEQIMAPSLEIHATLVDVYGLGVLLTGASGVGKSETALGLIERRHRLVCDDLVHLRVADQRLLGLSRGLTRHLMEVRGIGLINVAHLYGVVSVIDQKQVDLVVELEHWDDSHDYDRLGLEWRYSEWLDVKVPHHCLPVKPGRDLVLLVETLALNHRLRAMGYHSARDLSLNLEIEIQARSHERKE